MSREGSAERNSRLQQGGMQLRSRSPAGSSNDESMPDLQIVVGQGRRSFGGEGVLRQAAIQV